MRGATTVSDRGRRLRLRRYARRLSVLTGNTFVAAWLGAVAAGAQSGTAPATVQACTHVREPTADSATLYGALRVADPEARPTRAYLDGALREIARRFVAHPSTLPVFGEIAFTARSDGHTSDVRPLTPGMDRHLAASAMSAIDAAGAVRALGELPPGIDSLQLRLAIDPLPDSSTATVALGRVLRRGTASMVRFEFEVQTPVRPRAGNPAPSYPEAARTRGVDGYVLMQFVVDEDGWAIPETFRLLKANYREFVQAVLKVLPGYRFHPAEIGGCTVKQLVQMPFTFTIQR